MDIISISLGVSGGWAEDILSVVADRIVAKGIHGNTFNISYYIYI